MYHMKFQQIRCNIDREVKRKVPVMSLILNMNVRILKASLAKAMNPVI